jgi:uncharacterized membrane protein
MTEKEDNRPASGTHSTVAIRNHPLHPALVDFPIAFLTGALVTDLLFWWTGSSLWAEFSFWLIIGGLVTGLLAFLTGLIDFLTIARARQTLIGWLHFLLADLALFLTTFNFFARLEDRQGSILYVGIGFSLIVTSLLLIAGYSGGRLVFGHRIGVYGREEGKEAE